VGPGRTEADTVRCYSATPVTPQRGEHTEGPCWDARTARLLWVDQFDGLVRIGEYDGEWLHVVQTHSLGSAVGAVVPSGVDDGWFVACAQGFAHLSADGTLTLLAQPEAEVDVDTRMNDGKCDPAGRFWAGSMAWDKRSGAGSLYRLELDHTVTVVLRGVSISNGLAWPDERTLYYIDTPTQRVDTYAIDADCTLRDRRTVVTVDGGSPDGMCIDAEGCLWVAVWGGSAVHRYAPDGTLVAVAEVAAPQVSSCCLGGTDGRTLFITTSQEAMDAADRARYALSGHLFATRVDVPGQPADAFGAAAR
jgi:sugar lactone lactonase YvrE